MSRYTVQQHDSFVSASYRRKHLNALILDLSMEYERTQNPQCTSNQGPQHSSPHLGASASVGQLSASLMAFMERQQQLQTEQQRIQSIISRYSRSSCSTAAQQEFDKAPSWLMPWQTGKRNTGRQFAAAIRSKRTPIGAFANHDLPVAPK